MPDDSRPLARPGATAARRSLSRLRGRLWRWGRLVWPISKLTRRVLTVNLLALALPIGGLLYLGEYRRGLMEAELERVRIEAGTVAAAVGASAVTWGEGDQHLLPETTRTLLHRMLVDSPTRAQFFDLDGAQREDTRLIRGAKSEIEIEPLPLLDSQTGLFHGLFAFYDKLFDRLTDLGPEPAPFPDPKDPKADHYPSVLVALAGEPHGLVLRDTRDRPVFVVAMPVQHYKKVLGAMLFSRTSEVIDEAVTQMRLTILRMSGVGFAVTVMLSLYLAGTITRPVRRLAHATDRFRLRRGQSDADDPIPDYAHRRDEIGDLSVAVRTMTDALSTRMTAIERFAADVAHEIKNPLTSLRSAVETAVGVKARAPDHLSTEDRRRIDRLFAIIEQDVVRMDRLISDIADASRVDADLIRTPSHPVDLGGLLARLADASHTAGEVPALLLTARPRRPVMVLGIEDRLIQALGNLIANARSFSPPEGTVRLSLDVQGQRAVLCVEDDGPGVPEGDAERIFERFYTERPDAEPFGGHSGLGLSIGQQIIEAHGGRITAETWARGGAPGGARFEIRLPVLL